MPRPVLARRAAAVSATFVLALGACGVAASSALADTAPARSGSSQPAEAPETGDPAFTLIGSGAGSFALQITIPGTSIAVAYTVDLTGAVTAASTGTAGVTVTVHDQDLTITLFDGRAIKVELGDAGNTVQEVSVDEQNDESTQDEQGKDQDEEGDSQDEQGDNQKPDVAVAPTSSSADQNHGDQADDNGSSDDAGDLSDSGN